MIIERIVKTVIVTVIVFMVLMIIGSFATQMFYDFGWTY